MTNSVLSPQSNANIAFAPNASWASQLNPRNSTTMNTPLGFNGKNAERHSLQKLSQKALTASYTPQTITPLTQRMKTASAVLQRKAVANRNHLVQANTIQAPHLLPRP